MREDWIETKLDEIVIKMTNGSSAKQHNEKIGLPISRIETIWNEGIDFERVKYIEENDKEFIEKYSLQNNDILLSHINSDSHLGKTAIYKTKYGTLIHGINLLLLRPSKELNADFLNYQFKHIRFRGDFVAVAQRAVNQSSINQQKLKQFDIKLAPLLEQKAIVAKIEQLFSELDNAVANLKTAQAKLKIYRQAVLKKAFEGELTKEWREKQTNLPTADELLEQIKKEREVHYKQQLEEWKQAVKEWEENGQNSKKPSKPKQYKEKIEKFEYTKTKIPENWNWTAFGKLFLTSPQNGIYKPASDYGTGTYIIRIDDFYDGKLIKKNGFKRLRLTDDEAKIYGVEENSIFINRVNSMEYLGKCALVEKLDENVVFESNIMKINTMLVNNKYLTIFLSSRKGMQNLQINAKQAVNQASINQTDVSSTLVPLCSLEEQNQIVQEIESRLSVCDKIEETIKTTLAKSEALRQSILKKAFEGKLLSAQELENIKNHPEYESAEALLKRIKKERTK
ncbi:MAG: restriction endonuclease subunit S [Epsilonproteobacteria bacterium]|nr:restriction endonuclease subunit S [Campylobacterota bacterium]